MSDLASYGPLALPLAIISVLAQIIYNMTKKRRENGNTEDFRSELRNDILAVRRHLHEIRDTLQVIVTKMALAEYRISRLEDRDGRSS